MDQWTAYARYPHLSAGVEELGSFTGETYARRDADKEVQRAAFEHAQARSHHMADVSFSAYSTTIRCLSCPAVFYVTWTTDRN